MRLALLSALTTFAALVQIGPVTAPDLAGSIQTAPPQPPDSATRTTLPADGRNTQAGRVPSRAARLHSKRVAKAQRIVATFADYDGRASFLPHCEALVSYCEEVAEEHDEPDFAATWYYALVYGYANFGLRCYSVAKYPPSEGDDCAGPFDVKKEPVVTDPIANMRHHVDEQFRGWQAGYRGRGLCEYVMLPSAPRDWDGGRFARTDRKFRRCIQRGYEVGNLP